MGYYDGADRDALCARDVGKMAALGRFDKEFELYGCTYQTEDDIFYCISQQLDAIQNFFMQSTEKHICPTPPERYIKRISVPSDMYDELLQETKIEMAQKLQAQYGTAYFRAMAPYMQTPPNDASYTLLCSFAEKIDGYFEPEILQIFEGTVQFAYQAKILSDSRYAELQQWFQDKWIQLEGMPFASKGIDRIFHGICYEENEVRKTFIDIQKKSVFDKKQYLENKGILVSPIFYKRYSMRNFSEMPTLRKKFQEALQFYFSPSYFAFLKNLKTLPGVINHASLVHLKETLSKTCSAEAAWSCQYYLYRWNKK